MTSIFISLCCINLWQISLFYKKRFLIYGNIILQMKIAVMFGLEKIKVVYLYMFLINCRDIRQTATKLANNKILTKLSLCIQVYRNGLLATQIRVATILHLQPLHNHFHVSCVICNMLNFCYWWNCKVIFAAPIM